MANALQVSDIRLTVTQSSAAEVELRPAMATEGAASVTNPAQAVDGDVASYAELTDDTASPATLTLSQFPNTTKVSDAGRDFVELTITADWANTPDAGDSLVVKFRGKSTDAWTTVDTSAGGANWDGSARTFEVTTPAGSNLEADWEVALEYTRNVGAGTFQVVDVTAAVGGDVVAPTTAEVEEDVASLASARFAADWATLTAAVDAALGAFGATALERDATLNAVRDQETAADAEATLTAAAARASAAAYADLATSLGVARFTGNATD